MYYPNWNNRAKAKSERMRADYVEGCELTA
jgi:hypothetical protein